MVMTFEIDDKEAKQIIERAKTLDKKSEKAIANLKRLLFL